MAHQFDQALTVRSASGAEPVRDRFLITAGQPCDDLHLARGCPILITSASAMAAAKLVSAR